MKAKPVIAFVTTAIILNIAPLLADDAPRHVTKAERRLLKIDLNILFEQYKKARTLLGELDFQNGLSEAQGNARTDKERQALDRQRDFLRQELDILRARIMQMGEKAEEMGGLKEKDKSKKKADS